MFKIRLSLNKAIRYFYFIIIILCIFVFAWISFFLYDNFYQTIVNTDEALILNQEVTPENIDMDRYNRVIEKIEEKTK